MYKQHTLFSKQTNLCSFHSSIRSRVWLIYNCIQPTAPNHHHVKTPQNPGPCSPVPKKIKQDIFPQIVHF